MAAPAMDRNSSIAGSAHGLRGPRRVAEFQTQGGPAFCLFGSVMKSAKAVQFAEGLKVAAGQLDTFTNAIDASLTADMMAEVMKRTDAAEVRAIADALLPLRQSCESLLAVIGRLQHVVRQNGGGNV